MTAIGITAQMTFTMLDNEDLPVYWETVEATGFLPWRQIEAIRLIDCSFVEFPANPYCIVESVR